MTTTVDLGFLEKNGPLYSQDFPSKVGGKPAWLNLKQLPASKRLACKKCDQPMILLLQVYAPVEDIQRCFHRSLFVFMCKTALCCEENNCDNFVVFRCQLSRANEFYSYDPPEENDSDVGPSAAHFNKLCEVCGCLALNQCAKCKKVNYCSKQHQRVDWNVGHKVVCCSSSVDEQVPKSTEDFLLPEFEIVTEGENYEAHINESYEAHVYENYMENVSESDEELDVRELEQFATKTSDRKFQEFKKRISHEPEQVVRYQKNGVPLWVSSENIPKNEEIPNCKCGAPRHFEFQVLPQMLISLKLDSKEHSIDWGTLAVYTCSQNCETTDEAYYDEFIWKQDFSETI